MNSELTPEEQTALTEEQALQLPSWETFLVLPRFRDFDQNSRAEYQLAPLDLSQGTSPVKTYFEVVFSCQDHDDQITLLLAAKRSYEEEGVDTVSDTYVELPNFWGEGKIRPSVDAMMDSLAEYLTAQALEHVYRVFTICLVEHGFKVARHDEVSCTEHITIRKYRRYYPERAFEFGMRPQPGYVLNRE